MKRLEFDTKKAFLSQLDGKVYAICNGDGNFICDVLEETYLILLDAGRIVSIENDTHYCPHSMSDYVLSETLNDNGIRHFKEEYGVEIIIK